MKKVESPLANVPWVESPLFPKLLAEENLTPKAQDLARTYAEQGYVVIDFPSENIEEMAEDVRKMFAVPEGPHGRIQDAWRSCGTVREIATNKGVLAVLNLLYKRQPIPFQTLNFPVGTQQALHSDTLHFHSVPHRFMCGVWVALEDIDEDNGPLHVIRGSHTLPIWNMHDLGLPRGYAHYQSYEQHIREMVETLEMKTETVLLRKGQAIIWAANLLHGGEPIRDPARTRLSQVTHYFFSDCLYYTPMDSDPYLGRVALRNVTNIIDGKIVTNMYNGKPLDQATILALRGEQEGGKRKTLIQRVIRKVQRGFTVPSPKPLPSLHRE